LRAPFCFLQTWQSYHDYATITSNKHKTGKKAIEQFRYFHSRFPHLDIEHLIEYYAVFGGLEKDISLQFNDTIESSIQNNILKRYDFLETKIMPPLTRQSESRRMLRAVAVSDGKTINVFRRASLSRSLGHGTYHALQQAGVLYKELSRETAPSPLLHKKRSERRYSIQSKIKFIFPFQRFWYTFIEPFGKEIEAGHYENFYQEFRLNFDRYVSFTFEELSNALIKEIFERDDPVSEKGNYWDRHNEFDLLARTKARRLIVGECKWKGHKICKSLVSKLKSKCEKSGLDPDYLALFSKSGFSKELKNSKDPSILCYDLKDFEKAVMAKQY